MKFPGCAWRCAQSSVCNHRRRPPQGLAAGKVQLAACKKQPSRDESRSCLRIHQNGSRAFQGMAAGSAKKVPMRLFGEES